MYDVCISYESGKVMQYWDQLLTNFGVSAENVWVRDLPTDVTNLYSGAYDQRDAEGFIKINSLRLKTRQK